MLNPDVLENGVLRKITRNELPRLSEWDRVRPTGQQLWLSFLLRRLV